MIGLNKYANNDNFQRSINENLITRLKSFNKTSKLRKAVVTLIATQISDIDISEEISMFDKFDDDKDGYINFRELE